MVLKGGGVDKGSLSGLDLAWKRLFVISEIMQGYSNLRWGLCNGIELNDIPK